MKSKTPRPASTLILVRDGREGLEIFLLRRAVESPFLGGYYVFPGGAVDPEDHFDHWRDAGLALDDATASRRLNLEAEGFAYWMAAIRECFEEAGLLLAEGPTPPAETERAALRERLNDGTLSFRACIDRLGLRPALDRLAYLSHWIAPIGTSPRFDTRFFVALAPAGQIASHDCGEIMDHLWLRPAEALARRASGEFLMIGPTAKTVELLAEFDNCDALMAHLAAPRNVEPIMPRRASGRDGPRSVLPHEYAYAEVGKLDPEGKGGAAYEIIPGVPVRLSPWVRRLTAPNPGFMTGPGTNSYLLGDGNEIAVIDPGPDLTDHVNMLIEEARGANGAGRVRWILATHTHSDHSPAAMRLKALTGAEVIGLPAPAADRQDMSFQPDRVPQPNERLVIAGCTLRAIHTPGHASNHVCYLLEEERILFAGDHLMQGSTVVINPPDGNMAAYVDALRALRREEIDYIAPGHGFLMDRHRALIDALLAHRQQREDKVLAALRQKGEASIADLLPLAYDDVPPRIHPLAARSLLAHLIKLRQEGRAEENGGRWIALA